MLSNLRFGLAPAMWGSTYAVTTQLLPADRPMLAATARALLAGLIVLAATRTLPQGSWWWRSLILGTLNIGAFFALLFVAAVRLPGGLAAVLTSVQPVIVLALTPIALGESVRARQFALALLGTAGIAILVLGATIRLDPLGMLAALGAAASAGIGLVLTRRWRPPVGVWTLTGWQLTAGGLVLLPILLATEGLPSHLDAGAIGGFAWLIGPSTIGGYYLWFGGLRRLAPAALAALGTLSPITAAAIGWAWLHQSLSPVQLVGAAVALLAMLLMQTNPPTPRRNQREGSYPEAKHPAALPPAARPPTNSSGATPRSARGYADADRTPH